VVVSLLTAPEPEPKTADFFTRLDVSTDHTRERVEASRAEGKTHEVEGISEAEAAALGKKTAATGDQLLLTNLARLRASTHGFGFFHAYRNDLAGLAACWGVVALLVGIAWAILQL